MKKAKAKKVTEGIDLKFKIRDLMDQLIELDQQKKSVDEMRARLRGELQSIMVDLKVTRIPYPDQNKVVELVSREVVEWDIPGLYSILGTDVFGYLKADNQKLMKEAKKDETLITCRNVTGETLYPKISVLKKEKKQ